MSAEMSSKSDCGCGCGGSGGGCGCGGASHAQAAYGSSLAVYADSSFCRPRFFPNQLLTHDSLQGLVDYVVGKNRLHNRFLFGDGVVCGLTVTCHPCGEGKVIVAPGYALDCCGNDILVPCPEGLDVKALIRDLRKRQMAGYDCGDPCEKSEDGIESYGLYIVYDEAPTDPVAPYNTGEPCGQQDCQPSQICEGYRFELRCDCTGPQRVDVFDRIRACIGDLREATAAFSKAQSAERQASRTLQASRIVASEAEIGFPPESIAALRQNAEALAALNEFDIDTLDDDGNPRAVPVERALRLNVAQTQLLTGAITRFRLLSPQAQKAAMAENNDLGELLEAAQAALRDAATRIEFLAPRVFSTQAARTEAEESLRLAQRYAIDDPDAGRLATEQAKFVALNAPVSARQAVAMQTAAAQVKAWLLEKLANSTSLTRCDLYDRIKRVRLDDVPNTDAAGLNASSRAVVDLVYLLVEYLIDCICLALNPPCQPCEDRGVLLACLKVKDCDVIDICNMSRGYVLSPVALRYWLPPIGAIGRLFERFCCEFELRRPKEVPPAQSVPEFLQARPNEMPIVASYAPAVSEAAVDDNTALVLKQFNIAPAEVASVSAFASNLGLLSLSAAGADIGVADLRAGRILENVLGDRAQVREAMETTFNSIRGSGNAATETPAAPATDIRSEVETEVVKQLRSVSFRDAIKANTTVKNLQAENRRLRADMKKMADAIDKIEKGSEK